MKKGFTLIELLVVISIIGILSSVVLSSLAVARQKARDAKRKEDLHSIQTALALYYDTYGVYPPVKAQTSCGGGDVWASSNGSCGGQWLTTDSNFYTFLANVPIDPLNTGQNAGWSDGNYVYSYYLGANNDYDLLTQLETSDSSDCQHRAANYHGVYPPLPWCAPWANNLGRSQHIYTDH